MRWTIPGGASQCSLHPTTGEHMMGLGTTCWVWAPQAGSGHHKLGLGLPGYLYVI